MAFMCRSSGVQRWSAGAAKDPLFQTPTVPGNCKVASPLTSAHFHLLYYHKMWVVTHLCPNVSPGFHVCSDDPQGHALLFIFVFMFLFIYLP